MQKVLTEIFSILEAWNQKTGVYTYDTPKDLAYRKLGSKRVEMSPDEYIKKATNTFRRNGSSSNAKQIEQGRAVDRDDIEDLKNKIKDPKAEMDEPYLRYYQQKGNAYDDQEGLHRAIAAKELGHEKIPVHIIYPNTKRSPQEKRQLKQDKIEGRKEAGRRRAEERRFENNQNQVRKTSDKSSPVTDSLFRNND